jgi:hypothetical protein
MGTAQVNQQLDIWLLISVSTAGASDSLRVYVWRRLRLLGAVYLQQSVCLLPAVPDVRKEVSRFADRVRRDGGSVRVLGIQLTDSTEQQQLIADFNQARDREYREVLERLPSFLQELDMERQRGRMTYAEVEESEADLERFRAWLAKIAKRDYFHAPLGDDARQAVERCAQALADFEAAAFAAEGAVETEGAATPHRADAGGASENSQ